MYIIKLLCIYLMVHCISLNIFGSLYMTLQEYSCIFGMLSILNTEAPPTFAKLCCVKCHRQAVFLPNLKTTCYNTINVSISFVLMNNILTNSADLTGRCSSEAHPYDCHIQNQNLHSLHCVHSWPHSELFSNMLLTYALMQDFVQDMTS